MLWAILKVVSALKIKIMDLDEEMIVRVVATEPQVSRGKGVEDQA